MGMNFLGSNNNASAGPSLLNLEKGEVLDLTKKAPSLKSCILGCGWDVNVAGADNFDLDISAFMLDVNRRIKRSDVPTRVVYFNATAQQGVWSEGDNLTGSGDGDDERIHVDLDEVPDDVYEILFVVNIYDAQVKRQTFGMISNSYIRLLDAENGEKEIAKYELKENAANSTAVVFASLKRRKGGGWEFEAIGESLVVSNLEQLLLRYM